ncbi:Transposon Ty3-I Gag-Pol polyprotein [Porphyridium purpureum]|uniref:RNA-directed DNA polymerase n=1 Tax=Porphyridium purpureum TaxID=35688 RepID=A0A5J4YZT8_PORPP|nr:Transposon Ty3-I Gag-Pol polyprotein [Porphyridium purpureum]|eukprot:POR0323..scf209_3
MEAFENVLRKERMHELDLGEGEAIDQIDLESWNEAESEYDVAYSTIVDDIEGGDVGNSKVEQNELKSLEELMPVYTGTAVHEAGEQPPIFMPVTVPTSRGDISCKAKVDTGAGPAFIDHGLFAELEGESRPIGVGRLLTLAPDGRTMAEGYGGQLCMKIPGFSVSREAVQVLPVLKSGLLIGRNFLKKYRASIDFEKERVSCVRSNGSSVCIPFNPNQPAWTTDSVDEVQTDALQQEKTSVLREIASLNLQGMGESSERVREILKQHADVFVGSGCIRGEKYKILLKPDAVPVNVKEYRRTVSENALEKAEVARHIRAGNLEFCPASEWGAQNVFVKKKDGRVRMTTDFRGLNQCIRQETYPLRDVAEVVEFLARQRVYTALDLKDGFFNVSLAPDCRHLTAVKTAAGLVQYCKVPQGLVTSPFVMQRASDNLLRPFAGQAINYQDDMYLASSSEEEHVKLLSCALEHMKNAGARLNLSKCRFGVNEVEVLGHHVKYGEIRPSEKHVEDIRRLVEPHNAAALVRFLGLTNWFSNHIPRYADIAVPLYDVLKGTGWNAKKKSKYTPVVVRDFDRRWGDNQRNAWHQLKEALVSAEVLAAPIPFRKKRLYTDASVVAIGGVLMQEDEGGGWRPVAYVSRRLKGAEVNYTVSEKELLAILHCARKLRHLMHGEHVEYITDHQALSWLLRQKAPSGRLARWLLELQEQSFAVKYQAGANMEAPDCLSRDVAGEDDSDTVDEIDQPRMGLPSVQELVESQKAAREQELPNWSSDMNDFSQNELGLVVRKEGDEEAVWVPQVLVPRVLGYFHGPAWAGHFGRERMLRRLKGKFWWPKMRESIVAFLERCVHCAIERLPKMPRRVKGILAPWIPVRRFEIVAMDILTVSPTSADGNKKILVMIDLFTRYVACVPLKDESIDSVANAFLEGWVFRFGAPERLLSDRGVTFLSEVIESICASMGIRRIYTSPYHPEGNGMVERFNRTIMSEIRARITTTEKAWDRHVAMATYAYNTSFHDTTGVTPFQAMFGTPAPELDRDILFVGEEQVAAELNIEQALRKLHELMNTNTAHRRAQVERWYNARIADFGLVPGRRVLVFDPPMTAGLGRKLRQPWRGPYRIKEYTRWNNVILESEKDGSIARSHLNRLAVISPSVRESTLNPAISGVFPDTRVLLRKIVEVNTAGEKMKLLVRLGAAGPVWVDEEQLPPVILTLLRQELSDRAQRQEQQENTGTGAGREHQVLQAITGALEKRRAEGELEREVVKRVRRSEDALEGRIGAVRQ